MARTGTLGSLFIDLAANTATFETDMGRAARVAEQQSNAMKRSIERAVVDIAVAFEGLRVADRVVESFKGVIDNADKIGKSAQKIGLTTSELSGLQYAAKIADVQFDELVGGLEKFNKASVAAKDRNSEQARAFRALGIEVLDANGKLKPTNTLLLEVADKFSHAKDGADKTALAMALFGKTGAELIPFLNQGKDGISKLTDEAQKFGIVIDAQTSKAATEFNDNLKRIHAASEGLATKIAARLLPTFQELSDKFVKYVSDADNVDLATRRIDAGLKLLASTGLVTASTFLQAATIVGGVAGFWERIGQGNKVSDLTAGFDILKQSFSDAGKIGTDYYHKMSDVWDDLPKQAQKAATDTAAANDKTDLSFNKTATAAEKQAEKIKALIDGLQKQVALFGNLTELEKVQISLAEGYYGKVTPAQKAQLEGLAKELDLKKALAEHDKELLKEEEKRTAELKRQEEERGRHAIAAADRALRRETRGDLTGNISANPLAAGGLTKEALKEENDFYAAQQKEFKENKQALIDAGKDYDQVTEAAARKHQEELARIEQIGQKAKIQAITATIDVTSNALGVLADLQDKSSREGFRRYKEFAIAQAIISTISGAIKAFESLASIPYVGPYLGAAAAAVALAAGYAQVQTIRSQQFTGRKFGGPVDSGGIYEVNEGGDPELLKLGNRTMLLMGSQNGQVVPASMAPTALNAGASGFKLTMHLYGAAPGATAQMTHDSDGARLEIFANGVEARLANNAALGRGPLVKTLERTYPAMQRSGV